MPRSGESARTKLIGAAERLFAARGVDGVTLADINVAAGQRNNSAVQYHFGDKQGLLEAILDKHQAVVDQERTRLLDEVEAAGSPAVEDLAAVLVLPLAGRLDDPGGGAEYLQILAGLLGHREMEEIGAGLRPGARRLMALAEGDASPLSPSTRRIRRVLLMTLLVHGLADFSRMHPGAGSSEREEFVQTLLGSIVALMRAPVPSAG
jgi:AcrR family transcriptional regulator